MERIATALWEFMSILGGPKVMQSENRPEFVNQIVKELKSLNGFDHRKRFLHAISGQMVK